MLPISSFDLGLRMGTKTVYDCTVTYQYMAITGMGCNICVPLLGLIDIPIHGHHCNAMCDSCRCKRGFINQSDWLSDLTYQYMAITRLSRQADSEPLVVTLREACLPTTVHTCSTDTHTCKHTYQRVRERTWIERWQWPLTMPYKPFENNLWGIHVKHEVVLVIWPACFHIIQWKWVNVSAQIPKTTLVK